MANIKELLASMIGKINGKLNAPEQAAQPHQQLVTDADGVAKWEDRLAYTNTLLSVQSPNGAYAWYKVSDEPLTGIEDVDMDADIAVWLNGERGKSSIVLKQDDFIAVSELLVVAVLRDDCTIELNGVKFGHFPKRGMYFVANADVAVTAVAIDKNATEPDISWDKNTETIKTIDPKYLPDSGSSPLVITLGADVNTGKFGFDTPFQEAWDALEAGKPVFAYFAISVDTRQAMTFMSSPLAMSPFGTEEERAITFTVLQDSGDNAVLTFYNFLSDETVEQKQYQLANVKL